MHCCILLIECYCSPTGFVVVSTRNPVSRPDLQRQDCFSNSRFMMHPTEFEILVKVHLSAEGWISNSSSVLTSALLSAFKFWRSQDESTSSGLSANAQLVCNKKPQNRKFKTQEISYDGMKINLKG